MTLTKSNEPPQSSSGAKGTTRGGQDNQTGAPGSSTDGQTGSGVLGSSGDGQEQAGAETSRSSSSSLGRGRRGSQRPNDVLKLEEQTDEDKNATFLAFLLVLKHDPFSEQMEAVLEAAAPAFPQVMVVKGDAQLFTAFATQYSIRSFPRLLFFRNGLLMKKFRGERSPAAVAALFMNLTKSLPVTMIEGSARKEETWQEPRYGVERDPLLCMALAYVLLRIFFWVQSRGAFHALTTTIRRLVVSPPQSSSSPSAPSSPSSPLSSSSSSPSSPSPTTGERADHRALS